MKVSKSAIRRELRALRRQLPLHVVEAAGRAVAASIRRTDRYRSSVSVVAYLACENEIPVSGIFEDVIAAGRTLFLPSARVSRCLKRWQPGEPLARGRWGTLEPQNDDPALPSDPTLALVPLVAWDPSGTRLGRGMGFYDRLFGSMDVGIYRVGVGYEFQCWPELPRDPWDVGLHSVITECRIVECPSH